MVPKPNLGGNSSPLSELFCVMFKLLKVRQPIPEPPNPALRAQPSEGPPACSYPTILRLTVTTREWN